MSIAKIRKRKEENERDNESTTTSVGSIACKSNHKRVTEGRARE